MDVRSKARVSTLFILHPLMTFNLFSYLGTKVWVWKINMCRESASVPLELVTTFQGPS